MGPTCLLDSGIIIDVLNDKRGRPGIIRQLLEQGAELACCSINVTEVYAGLKPGEEIKTARFLKSLRFFEVTWDIAKLAGDLQNQWRRQGRTLSLPDVTVAAVALSHHLVLATNNHKDFPMPELTLYPLPEASS
jgi:predicted nucleic acid-binding protein